MVNGVTICVHLKHFARYRTKTYVVALACVDMFACVVPLPLSHVLKNDVANLTENEFVNKCYVLVMTAASTAYTSLLTATALDRLQAVCFPYTYTKRYNVRSAILLSAVVLVSVWGGVVNFASKDPAIGNQVIAIMTMQLAVLWLLTVVFYIVIITSLYRQGRRIAAAARHNTGTVTAQTRSVTARHNRDTVTAQTRSVTQVFAG